MGKHEKRLSNDQRESLGTLAIVCLFLGGIILWLVCDFEMFR